MGTPSLPSGANGRHQHPGDAFRRGLGSVHFQLQPLIEKDEDPYIQACESAVADYARKILATDGGAKERGPSGLFSTVARNHLKQLVIERETKDAA